MTNYDEKSENKIDYDLMDKELAEMEADILDTNKMLGESEDLGKKVKDEFADDFVKIERMEKDYAKKNGILDKINNTVRSENGLDSLVKENPQEEYNASLNQKELDEIKAIDRTVELEDLKKKKEKLENQKMLQDLDDLEKKLKERAENTNQTREDSTNYYFKDLSEKVDSSGYRNIGVAQTSLQRTFSKFKNDKQKEVYSSLVSLVIDYDHESTGKAIDNLGEGILKIKDRKKLSDYEDVMSKLLETNTKCLVGLYNSVAKVINTFDENKRTAYKKTINSILEGKGNSDNEKYEIIKINNIKIADSINSLKTPSKMDRYCDLIAAYSDKKADNFYEFNTAIGAGLSKLDDGKAISYFKVVDKMMEKDQKDLVGSVRELNKSMMALNSTEKYETFFDVMEQVMDERPKDAKNIMYDIASSLKSIVGRNKGNEKVFTYHEIVSNGLSNNYKKTRDSLSKVSRALNLISDEDELRYFSHEMSMSSPRKWDKIIRKYTK